MITRYSWHRFALALAILTTLNGYAGPCCCPHQQSGWSSAAIFAIKAACVAGTAYIIYDYFSGTKKIKRLVVETKKHLEQRLRTLEQSSVHHDDEITTLKAQLAALQSRVDELENKQTTYAGTVKRIMGFLNIPA